MIPPNDRRPAGHASRFFPGTARSYDRVVGLFTLGLDAGWKRAMLRRVPRATRILDLACGTGIVSRKLAQKFPDAAIVGVDLTPDYLEVYRDRIRKGWFKADAQLADAQTVKLNGLFDAVVSSYLPKYVNAETMLKNLVPHLEHGAVVVFHDFTMPPSRTIRALWRGYTWLMNRLGFHLFPEWHEVFDDGLTNLIEQTSWYDDFPNALQQCGFTDISSTHLTLGSAGMVSAYWKHGPQSTANNHSAKT